MSNVIRRRRKETGLEFWDVSVELTAAIIRFVMNDKNVPKSYRFVFSFPIIEIARDMRKAIVCANTIYPCTEHDLQRRRDHQQDAINACENIIQALQDMLEVLTGIDIDRLDRIGELLMKESTLLRAWRKSTKLMKER